MRPGVAAQCCGLVRLGSSQPSEIIAAGLRCALCLYTTYKIRQGGGGLILITGGHPTALPPACLSAPSSSGNLSLATLFDFELMVRQ